MPGADEAQSLLQSSLAECLLFFFSLQCSVAERLHSFFLPSTIILLNDCFTFSTNETMSSSLSTPNFYNDNENDNAVSLSFLPHPLVAS